MGQGRDTGTSWASMIFLKAALMVLSDHQGRNLINVRKKFFLPSSVDSNPPSELSFCLQRLI